MLRRKQRIDSATVRTSRRGFLKFAGGVGAGLTLMMNLPQAAAETAAAAASKEGDFMPNAFVRIGTDNRVTVFIKHLEMGQGTFTGLATLVAEELDAAWEQIDSEHAAADAGKYANLFWGTVQGTGSSTAIANAFMQMRLAGATARAMLVAAAASEWRVPVAEISVSQGVVSHAASGRQAPFGDLAEPATRQPVPPEDSLRLKTPQEFIYIGKQQQPRKDRGKTDGSAIFTQDIQLPDMLIAVVAHPPLFGARASGVDAAQARQVPGVVDVVQIESGVAVLANDTWSAKKGRDALKIHWDESSAFKGSSPEIMARYRELTQAPGLPARSDGDAASALAAGANVIEADFEFPYLAHATMEPMNCVVRVGDGECEIWNGDQIQTLDQGAAAQVLGIKPEQVRIHTLFAGGSFGRRANPHSDYVLEAVRIAKSRPGTAVKLVWLREDDTRAGYYRPAYAHKIRATLDENGMPEAWEHRIAGQSILKGTAFEGGMVKDGVDSTSVEGAVNLPYRIPNLRVELHTVEEGPPVQWWRSVGSTHTAFSTEVFIDRLARAAGQDPVAYRMQLLEGHPRHQGVLKLAAEKAGWGSELPAGRSLGVAVHESFNTYVAQVAEVSLQDDGGFRVERVVCAVDCGIAVNPDVIRAQMEGGIGYGLSPAMMSEISLDQGRVAQSNFHDYQVLRISQMPEIEVHIVPSAEAPTGVGEPGTPVIAPAVANALESATGQTLSRLPLKLA
ncbi:MAG: xanthine dehydrogenase family protein molybdopterin-binding subunit [Oceanospirillaceae bacterium]|nr:xanthine dehydrogenase family protein molybdopterin-binding subunit [Oceanospirillaceae bacterium]